ncbi:MAG: hypothetical protein J6Z11_02980 [Candidatus Riflebacteria bacterium]|nr:hypothetical protein [Candidatus Riflebacteria bacterium]
MKNKTNILLYTLIFFSICFYTFLTGCGGAATDDLAKNPSSPYSDESGSSTIVPQSKPITITTDGKVVRTTSPSGLVVLEAPEQNTYNSNVELRITESPSVGNESSLLTIGSRIYAITATRDGAPVKMLNHPLNLTFSNEEKLNSAENYYIGIKDINGGDWQFVNVYSSNPSSRLGVSSKNEFLYRLYKNNVYVALFADVKNSLSNTPKVFSLASALTPATLSTKNSIYNEDIKVNLFLSGENLSGLNANNFIIKVVYFSSESKDTIIKVDNRAVSYVAGSGSNRYEAFGEGYAHYFQFVPLNSKFTSGFNPSLFFDLNLKDLAETDFPTDFIVEISNADSSILSFSYSTSLHFSKINGDSRTDTNTGTGTGTGTNTDTNTGTDTSTGTNTGTGTYTGSNTGTGTSTQTKASIKLDCQSTNFPVTKSTIELEFSEDVPWTQIDKDKITIDNNAEITDCSYSNRILTLTLRNRLSYASNYNITVADLDYANGNTFTITTEDKATVSLKSVSEAFPVKDSPIELEFSKDIPWTVQDQEKISIDNDVIITSYQYNDKVLALGFSGKLQYSKTYKVSVADFEAVVNNDNLTFTTQSLEVTPVISSASQNIAPNTEGLLSVLQPKFFVNFGKEIASTTLAIGSIKFNGGDLPESCEITFDAASTTATIQFTENLDYYTEYQLSVTGYTDDDGGVINSTETPLTFTTSYPEDIVGEGTEESPYLIFSEAHLRKLNETTPVNYLTGNAYFKQMMNITLNDPWVPIGDNTNSFTGHYDGNDKSISGIRFSNNSSYVGFFGKISNSQIASLTIKDVDISLGEYSYLAALAGYSENSIIEGISIEDNISIISEDAYSGCLVGYAENTTIRNISGDAVITISSWNRTGAVAGSLSDSDISDVHITGTVKISANTDEVGGLVGVISNTAEHSVINCSVISNENGFVRGRNYVGGLIGNCSGNTNISQCYAKIPVSGKTYLGGLVGNIAEGSIVNCHSNCEITAENTVSYVGGLVGKCTVNVATSYAQGNINLNCTAASYVGTLLGFLGNSNSVEKCFTAVNISVSDGYTPSLPSHYVYSLTD